MPIKFGGSGSTHTHIHIHTHTYVCVYSEIRYKSTISYGTHVIFSTLANNLSNTNRFYRHVNVENYIMIKYNKNQNTSN